MITYYGEKKNKQKKGGQHKVKNIWIKDSEKCTHITVTITLNFILEEELENVKNKTSLIKYCKSKCNTFIFTSKRATKTKHKAVMYVTYQNKCPPE